MPSAMSICDDVARPHSFGWARGQQVKSDMQKRSRSPGILLDPREKRRQRVQQGLPFMSEDFHKLSPNHRAVSRLVSADASSRAATASGVIAATARRPITAFTCLRILP